MISFPLVFSPCCTELLLYIDFYLLTQDNDKMDESAKDADAKKKTDSDSEEEEQDNQQKERGISNKKKKVFYLTDLLSL